MNGSDREYAILFLIATIIVSIVISIIAWGFRTPSSEGKKVWRFLKWTFGLTTVAVAFFMIVAFVSVTSKHSELNEALYKPCLLAILLNTFFGVFLGMIFRGLLKSFLRPVSKKKKMYYKGKIQKNEWL